MNWLNRFQKQKSYIGLDIGSSTIKLLELDMSEDMPRLTNIAVSPLKGEAFTNNVIANPEQLSEQIASLAEANSIEDKLVVTCVPSPSVFTKRIKVPDLDDSELRSHIYFEAANFIPDNINNVKLDYHICGRVGKNQLECMVVAVKNEVIDSITNAIEGAGLKVGIVDIDYLAVQNMFELNYPELVSSTVALINIGSRFSSLNICKNGLSLLNGDISLGSKSITDAITQVAGVSAEEADRIKDGAGSSKVDQSAIKEVLDGAIEMLALEYNRQLNFLWSSGQNEGGIDAIVLSGSGSAVEELSKELAEKTGVPCHVANPLKNIAIGEGFDLDYVKSISPLMSACVGLALRQAGDRVQLSE